MAMIMKRVALGIGSNLGDRSANIDKALGEIELQIGRILLSSSVYETEPWGFETDDLFLNMALIAATELTPAELIRKIRSIEARLGRNRDCRKYSSRIVDIDILLYEDLIVDEDDLKIPHPLMHERLFVLAPLSEIAPQMLHPVLDKTVASLLASCTDTCNIRRLQ
jgi:2-amino-4-hydroxy-6-hydroxymethyldihydropteridine diphosphokinase